MTIRVTSANKAETERISIKVTGKHKIINKQQKQNCNRSDNTLPHNKIRNETKYFNMHYEKKC